jgi:ribosomal protein S18 acetylase RimI-like enzyme
MEREMVEYRSGLPEVVEYAGLFETTGWNASYKATPDDLRKALAASWWSISAYADNTLMGFGRVMSDGVLYAVIFDVIVRPDYRRRGVGSAIVQRLVDRCVSAGVRDIQLFSATGTTRFYESLGFRVRPAEAPGMKHWSR